MYSILQMILVAFVMRAAPSAAARVAPVASQLVPDACYSLNVGPFHPGASLYPNLPLTVRFNSRDWPFMRGVHVLQPTINMDAINFGSWEVVGQDSVRFGWVMPNGGLDMFVKLSNDSIKGIAMTRSSAIIRPDAYVKGARVTCPKHLRDAKSE